MEKLTTKIPTRYALKHKIKIITSLNVGKQAVQPKVAHQLMNIQYVKVLYTVTSPIPIIEAISNNQRPHLYLTCNS